DGAQTTIMSTQNAKKRARLAMSAAQPANRSKKPTRADTSLGISTGRWSVLIHNTSLARIDNGHVVATRTRNVMNHLDADVTTARGAGPCAAARCLRRSGLRPPPPR